MSSDRQEQRANEIVTDFGKFERGVRDCKEGVPHRVGQSIMYNRGYSAQKQLNTTGDRNGKQ